MALVEMRKMRLVGLRREREKLLGVLTDTGAFEASKTSLELSGENPSVSRLEELLTKLARINFAVNYIKSCVKEKEKADKKAETAVEPVTIKKGRISVTEAEFKSIACKGDELIGLSRELEEISMKRHEIAAAKTRIAGEIRQLSPYLFCPDRFSAFGNTETAFSVLLSGRHADKMIAELKKLGAVIVYSINPASSLIGYAGLKRTREEVMNLAADYSFTVCPFSSDKTAEEETAEKNGLIAGLSSEDGEALKKAVSYAERMDELRIYADWLGVEIDKANAEDILAETDSVFVLDGWVPAPKADEVLKAIKSASPLTKVWISEVEEKDTPPTLYKSNKVLEPYQALTDSYSPPSYFEIDPAPFTALFFFIFYGVMTADLGYGVILTIGALLFAKLTKPEKGMKNLVLLIGYSSFSTIVWGILFGSVFGLSFSELGGAFGVLGLPEKIWFNPMDEPLRLMLLSLMFGAAHITTGYVIHMYENIKEKKWTDAFFDDLFVIVTYVGVFLLILWIGNPVSGMFKVDAYPASFENLLMPGLIIMGTGLAGTVLTKGRKQKSVIMKVVIGLSGLYGVVNILSDVLSYARIFGLTIASCAIAFAFNIIINMIGGFGPIGFILAIVLAIVLHAFNMAMGVLSAYVHNARLQYLEFYGKFYVGEGKLFDPLGSHTKNVLVTQN